MKTRFIATFKEWTPIQRRDPFIKNWPYLSKGMKVYLSLAFGMGCFTVTKIDGDRGEAECGDILVRLKRIDNAWHQSTTSVNKRAVDRIKFV